MKLTTLLAQGYLGSQARGSDLSGPVLIQVGCGSGLHYGNGDPKIPCLLRDVDADTADALSLGENFGHHGMHPLDEAEAFASLAAKDGKDAEAIRDHWRPDAPSLSGYQKIQLSDDTTLQKYLRRNRSESLSNGADDVGIEQAETVAGCFGFLRGARERAMCLELRRKSGQILAINYSYVSRFEYQPDVGIFLHSSGVSMQDHWHQPERADWIATAAFRSDLPAQGAVVERERSH